MELDYQKISKQVNDFSKYIIACIKNEYGHSLTPEQIALITELEQQQFIIINSPNEKDIEFFSRQDCVEDPKKFDVSHVPTAHGGRTKGDNKIHIYPYAKGFDKCQNTEDVINVCVNDLITHEIFHYFIRPNVEAKEGTVEHDFGSFLTEGLVQLYSERFQEAHRFSQPQSNYTKNVEFAQQLLDSCSELSDKERDKLVFQKSYVEMLQASKIGGTLFENYRQNWQFHHDISNLIEESAKVSGFDENTTTGFIKHYKSQDDKGAVISDLMDKFNMIFSTSEEARNLYMMKLRQINPNIFDLVSEQKNLLDQPELEESKKR